MQFTAWSQQVLRHLGLEPGLRPWTAAPSYSGCPHHQRATNSQMHCQCSQFTASRCIRLQDILSEGSGSGFCSLPCILALMPRARYQGTLKPGRQSSIHPYSQSAEINIWIMGIHGKQLRICKKLLNFHFLNNHPKNLRIKYVDIGKFSEIVQKAQINVKKKFHVTT